MYLIDFDLLNLWMWPCKLKQVANVLTLELIKTHFTLKLLLHDSDIRLLVLISRSVGMHK